MLCCLIIDFGVATGGRMGGAAGAKQLEPASGTDQILYEFAGCIGATDPEHISGAGTGYVK